MLPLKLIPTMPPSINSPVIFLNFTRSNTGNIKLRRFLNGTNPAGRTKRSSRKINKIETKLDATNTSSEVVVLPRKPLTP